MAFSKKMKKLAFGITIWVMAYFVFLSSLICFYYMSFHCGLIILHDVNTNFLVLFSFSSFFLDFLDQVVLSLGNLLGWFESCGNYEPDRSSIWVGIMFSILSLVGALSSEWKAGWLCIFFLVIYYWGQHFSWLDVQPFLVMESVTDLENDVDLLSLDPTRVRFLSLSVAVVFFAVVGSFFFFLFVFGRCPFLIGCCLSGWIFTSSGIWVIVCSILVVFGGSLFGEYLQILKEKQ